METTCSDHYIWYKRFEQKVEEYYPKENEKTYTKKMGEFASGK